MKIKEYNSFVGKAIAKIRTNRGYTQEDFAKLCGLERSIIANIETGRQALMAQQLAQIVNALELKSYSMFFPRAPYDLLLQYKKYPLHGSAPLSQRERDCVLQVIADV